MSERTSPPRKRAAIACDYCRRRKRRCDGAKPTCSLCLDTNRECQYEDPEASRNALVSTLLQRLENVESELASNRNDSSTTPPAPTRGGSVARSDPCSPQTGQPASNETEVAFDPLGQGPAFPPRRQSPNSPLQHTEDRSPTQGRALGACLPAFTGAEPTDITIPSSHTTTTGSILQSPLARAFLGTYPRDLFLQTESRRQLPIELDLANVSNNTQGLPNFDPSITRELVDSYIHNVHTQIPILHPPSLRALHDRVVLEGDRADAGLVVLLLVLALGKVSSESTPTTTRGVWMPGVEYFTPALQYLLPAFLNSFSVDVKKPQSLFLAAVYYSYLMRPLQSWRLVNMASTTFQQIWLRYESEHGLTLRDSAYQPMLRLCWSIFRLESDILAEYHLPPSGIERFVERLSFPAAYEPESPPPYFLSWLADLSARILLNRIHNSMYSRAKQHATSPDYQSAEMDVQLQRPMIQVPLELNRQLQNWFAHLPHSIRPGANYVDGREVYKVILELRFHASGEIIFRPFLFQVLSLPSDATVDPNIFEHCKTCVSHCRNYLEVVHERVKAPSAQTEIVLHSTLAAVLLMTLCFLCPHTKHLASDIDAIQEHAIGAVRQWSWPGSSVESMLSLLVTMRDKCRAEYGFGSP